MDSKEQEPLCDPDKMFKASIWLLSGAVVKGRFISKPSCYMANDIVTVSTHGRDDLSHPGCVIPHSAVALVLPEKDSE